MRYLAIACLGIGLAACQPGDAGAQDDGVEASEGTPLPAVDDKAGIDRIAASLSDEGDYSDRAMFKSFMFGKKLLESGALKTRDKDRYSETTVETAIAAERARKTARDIADKSVEQRRAEGDITLAQADCDQMKEGFNGSPITYPMGYSFKGETYDDPCAALADNSD